MQVVCQKDFCNFSLAFSSAYIFMLVSSTSSIYRYFKSGSTRPPNTQFKTKNNLKNQFWLINKTSLWKLICSPVYDHLIHLWGLKKSIIIQRSVFELTESKMFLFLHFTVKKKSPCLTIGDHFSVNLQRCPIEHT